MTRIFSGIQPTGRKHLGNYIGAIRQYVEGQDRAGDGEAIYCIVDLHAVSVAYDPAELRERVRDTTAILLAAGLDLRQALPIANRAGSIVVGKFGTATVSYDELFSRKEQP